MEGKKEEEGGRGEGNKKNKKREMNRGRKVVKIRHTCMY